MITLLAVVVTLSGATEFQPITERTPNDVLYGYWISCPDNDDGSYGERIYQVRDRSNKRIVGELHLGGRDEYAYFDGDLGDEHVAHTSPLNRLGSAYHAADIRPKVGGRNWTFSGFHFNVVTIGGSDAECYYSVIRLEYLPRETVADASRPFL